MTTFSDLLLRTAKKLGEVKSARVTSVSGSASLISSEVVDADGRYDNGTLFITTGSNAGAVRIIQDYTSASGFRFAAALDYMPQVGDRFTATMDDYPLDRLEDAVNTAIEDLPAWKIAEDTTSLVTVEDQEEYTLPDGVRNLLRVEIAEDDEEPYDFAPHYGWEEVNGVLRFDAGKQPCYDDLPMRLVYVTFFDTLEDYDDELDPAINAKRIVWEAAQMAFRLRYLDDDTAMKKVDAMRKEARAELEGESPIIIRPDMQRDPHLANW